MSTSRTDLLWTTWKKKRRKKRTRGRIVMRRGTEEREGKNGNMFCAFLIAQDHLTLVAAWSALQRFGKELCS